MTSVAPQHSPTQRRGYRPAPTPRHHEHLALVALTRALANGHRAHRVDLPGGTIAARSNGTGHQRITLTNPAGHRIALAVLHGACLAQDAVRTVAEVFHRAPTDPSSGTRPLFAPASVAEGMKMRRNRARRWPRKDGSVRAAVPGAELIIRPGVLDASTTTGGLRLTLDGPWHDRATAQVADAILRDLAPEARHLTYTTQPAGHYINESGSHCYDSFCWAVCSCGWYYPAADRSDARWTASWHRQHPTAHRAPDEAYEPSH
ncbi:hypothetical protein [Actinomadura kijaniata]|uniref:hypothetical protein n=1 Tax=Actinomadura kijaniata TaxID=46161 RepID=UPI00082CE8F8|nr:hypothetical protein [Actinomadura kijaniata]